MQRLLKTAQTREARSPPNGWSARSCFQFLVGIYGGYFGAGIGILMLAALSILGLKDIHEMNSLKVVFGGSINGIAALYFIWAGMVQWPYVLIMAMGAIAGRMGRGRDGAQNGTHGGAPHRDRDRIRHGDLAVHQEITPTNSRHSLLSNKRYGTDSLRAPQPGQGSAAEPGGGPLAWAGDRREYRDFLAPPPDGAEFAAGENPEELVLVTAPGEFKGGRNSTNDSGRHGLHLQLPDVPRAREKRAGVGRPGRVPRNGRPISPSVSRPCRVSFDVVSGQYFRPGRAAADRAARIEPEDDRPAAAIAVAVLGLRLLARQAGRARTDVLNQPIRVNGQSFTIVGMRPKGFTGTTLGQEPNVYVPLIFKPQLTPNWNGTDRWNDYWLYMFGRLKPGRPAQQAEAALNGTYARSVEEQAKTVSCATPKRRQALR